MIPIRESRHLVRSDVVPPKNNYYVIQSHEYSVYTYIGSKATRLNNSKLLYGQSPLGLIHRSKSAEVGGTFQLQFSFNQ